MSRTVRVEPAVAPPDAEAGDPVTFTPLAPAGSGASLFLVRMGAGADVGGWHRHDQGQYLESIDGVGWAEELGGDRWELAPGDRLWCPPGTIHAHGAAATGAWTQFSLTPGGTEWFASRAEAEEAAAGSVPTRRTEEGTIA
ncbi:cupin domain-containing protein [Leucobacter sp.]